MTKLSTQRELVESASKLLAAGVAERIFPCASAAIVMHDEVATLAIGRHTFDEESTAVTDSTLFDLASLTKVLATTSMPMILAQRGALHLDTTVVELVPEFAGEDQRRHVITIRMLLAHSSGLPAYVRLFETCRTREELVAAALQVPLVRDPATEAEYSDIGFILLGLALERIAGESIDSFCAREVFLPLGMKDTSFRPLAGLRGRCAPTLDAVDFRHRLIQGEVHDENASVMGGVAPHAGLFATAQDVARFAQCMLRGGAPAFDRDVVQRFTRRESAPPGTSRAIGWDTPSAPSSSGRYFSPTSFGHLGFTGTSLWIDPEQQIAIVLLTNRTWPDNSEASKQGIRRFRPAFHDLIMERIRKA